MLSYRDPLNAAAKQVCVQAFQRSGFPQCPPETLRPILLGADDVQLFRGEVQGSPPGGPNCLARSTAWSNELPYFCGISS